MSDDVSLAGTRPYVPIEAGPSAAGDALATAAASVVTRVLPMLQDQHRRELMEQSAIEVEVIAERGYFTAARPTPNSNDVRRQLDAARIPTWATREDWYFPGLVIPWYRATGERSQLQFKPKSPVPNRDGKRMKYASAKGCSSLIDVHPRWTRDRGQDDPSLVPYIRDVATPLHITEGIKKADSLTSRGLCTVALNGVYNWRSALGTLGDWEDIPLKGRTVIVVFDADARTNRNVLTAMARIGKWLKSKGAAVRFAVPPMKHHGTDTKGIDDYFAAGGNWADIEMRATPPAAQITGIDRFTDAGLAEEVACECLEGHFIYTTGLGWLTYDGIRWSRTDEGTPSEAIRQYVRSEYLAAVDRKRAAIAADDTKAEEAASDDEQGWKQYQATTRLGALLKHAKDIAGVKRQAEEFDVDPDVLNTPAGLLHLDSGYLEQHTPDHPVTRVTAVSYVPNAEHEAFKAILGSIPDGAEEWLQVHLGQSITGHPAQRLVMLAGGGANGKTALMGCAYRALGGGVLGGAGYATLVPNSLLLSGQSKGAATPEKMELRGLRLAYIEETPEERFMDTQALKEVIDSEAIKGRMLYKDLVEWNPSHSIFLNTNHPPVVVETDHGTWRRLVTIRFPYRYRFEGDQYGEWVEGDLTGDPTLKAKLKDQRAHEAALAWLVQGALRWYGADRTLTAFVDPPVVADATTKWRHDSDTLLRFLTDSCEFDTDWWVSTQDLYKAFVEFCKETNQGIASETTFKKRLMGHTGLPGRLTDVRRRPSQGQRSERFLDPFSTQRTATSPTRGIEGLRFKRDGE